MKIEKMDIFGPMVENYTLNQCVTIKAQIKEYRNQRSNIYGLATIVFFSLYGLIAGSVWVLDWAGIITYVEDTGRDLIGPLLIWMVFAVYSVCDMSTYDRLTTSINGRINKLGGLDDGKKSQE